jgi:hypothetical protein
MTTMRIELRDEGRRRIGRVILDPAQRPTRVRPAESDREVFLHWEGAVDDAGHLRKCVVCECPSLFEERTFPQVTGVVVVLAFAGAAAGILGLAQTPPVLAAMAVVLACDVAVLVFARRRLVCYRCRTSYHGLPIARYHRSWDRATADRFESPPSAVPPASAATDSIARPTGEEPAPASR